MNRLIHIVAFAVLLLTSASCIYKMDPYEGGTGVRMTVNGRKFVMDGSPTQEYVKNVKNSTSHTVSFSVGMLGLKSSVKFNFSVSDADTLIQGRKYPAKASIEGLVDQSNKVNFAGEVELLVLEPNSQNVEGLFEFTGRKDGVEYSIKHGFFRLRQNGLKYRE